MNQTKPKFEVIFLDIDGVLNSTRTYLAAGGWPHDLSQENHPKFDWVAIKLLQRFCKITGAKVVISSTWRSCFTWERLGEYFDLPTIGQTEDHLLGRATGGRYTRGNEVKEWLDEHPEVTRYAILDDIDQFHQDQQPFLVKTREENGLSFQAYNSLCEIFGISPYSKPDPESS